MADRPVRRGPRPGTGPRLAVIEGFAGRRSAVPFALLILGVLGIGLLGLLMLNTAMGENSVRTAQAQQRQAALTDREQQLAQQLAGLSAPGALASQAAGLGLVPNPQPAFLNPSTGAVLGSASPAPTPSPTPTPTLTPSGTASGTPTGTVSGTASASAPASVAAAFLPTASGAPGAAMAQVVPVTSATAAGPTASAASTVSASPSGSPR